MNVFLACFLAVLFAMITRTVAMHTLTQWWVRRMTKRAIRRASAKRPAMMVTSKDGLPPEVQRQLDALAELQAAALDVAEHGPKMLPVLGAACSELYTALPESLRAAIRSSRPNSRARAVEEPS